MTKRDTLLAASYLTETVFCFPIETQVQLGLENNTLHETSASVLAILCFHCALALALDRAPVRFCCSNNSFLVEKSERGFDMGAKHSNAAIRSDSMLDAHVSKRSHLRMVANFARKVTNFFNC